MKDKMEYESFAKRNFNKIEHDAGHDRSFPPPSYKNRTGKSSGLLILFFILGMLIVNIVYTAAAGACIAILKKYDLINFSIGWVDLFLFVSVIHFVRQIDRVIFAYRTNRQQ